MPSSAHAHLHPSLQGRVYLISAPSPLPHTDCRYMFVQVLRTARVYAKPLRSLSACMSMCLHLSTSLRGASALSAPTNTDCCAASLVLQRSSLLLRSECTAPFYINVRSICVRSSSGTTGCRCVHARDSWPLTPRGGRESMYQAYVR